MDPAGRDVGSTLFEFLHMELVHALNETSEQKVCACVRMS